MIHFKDYEVYRMGVVCFFLDGCMLPRRMLWGAGDDHKLGRHRKWREEKVNGLANPSTIAHRARYNSRLRGEILDEEEKVDEGSDEEETFENILPLNNTSRCIQCCDDDNNNVITMM